MKTLVIDAGHGGKDPGAVGPTGLKEADLALTIAQGIRDQLRGDVKVTLTRDDDRFLELHERAAISNAAGADLFLSIHFNASNGKAEGYEVFTTPGQTAADPFASALFHAYKKAFPSWAGRTDTADGDPDKEASFAVIRRTNAPAVLFECQFIDHPEIEKWLRTPSNIDAITDALTDGILSFLALAPTVKPPATTPQDIRWADLAAIQQRLDAVAADLRSFRLRG